MTEKNNRKKLWCILASLALVIVVAMILDALPAAQTPPEPSAELVYLPDMETTGEAIETSAAPESMEEDSQYASATEAVTEAPASDPIPDSTETTAAPETEPEDVLPDNSVRLTFLGACAPGSPLGTSSYGSLNAAANKEGTGYFLSRLAGFLGEDDITLAANACLFTDSDTAAISLPCAAPAANADIYAQGSVEFVSLAAPVNSEYGSAVSAESEKALSDRNIESSASGHISYLELKGLRIAVLTTLLTKNSNLTDDIASVREAAQKADYTIVYFWGGEEESHTPEEWLTASLRRLADEGASLLVGAGNGVLRPVEQYGNATIAYSLGNLIDGTALVPENAAALLRLTLTPGDDDALTTSLEWIPCYAYDNQWQPCAMPEGGAAAQVRSFLSGASTAPVSG